MSSHTAIVKEINLQSMDFLTVPTLSLPLTVCGLIPSHIPSLIPSLTPVLIPSLIPSLTPVLIQGLIPCLIPGLISGLIPRPNCDQKH